MAAYPLDTPINPLPLHTTRGLSLTGQLSILNRRYHCSPRFRRMGYDASWDAWIATMKRKGYWA